MPKIEYFLKHHINAKVIPKPLLRDYTDMPSKSSTSI